MGLNHTLRERLYEALPKPVARRAGTFDGNAAIRRLLVLSKPGNPSFSYYIEERLRGLPVPVEVRSLDARLDDLDPHGTFVILCRYVKPRQLLWLRRHHGALSGIALFVDDDIAAMVTASNGPLDYRAYLLGMGVLPLFLLNGLMTHLWTSTDTLAEALAQDGLSASVLAPRPGRDQYRGNRARLPAGGGLRMVFHATGAHFSEHRFLIPIVAEALARHAHLSFEVIAKGAPIRWWKGLAADPRRLHICPPLHWPDYYRETVTSPADIALVPLLPGRTNDRRSDTKRIDVCRMQAAAIFSDCAIYRRCAVPGEIFVDNSPEAWCRQIDRLATDPLYRQQAREATAASMDVMRETSQAGFPGLTLRAPEAGHAA
jgi:hypothetical protein